MVEREYGNSEASIREINNNREVSDQVRVAGELIAGISESLRNADSAVTRLEQISDKLPESIANLRKLVTELDGQNREKNISAKSEHKRNEPEHGGLDKSDGLSEQVDHQNRESDISTQQASDISRDDLDVEVEVDYGR